jgi:hypothetical protein
MIIEKFETRKSKQFFMHICIRIHILKKKDKIRMIEAKIFDLRSNDKNVLNCNKKEVYVRTRTIRKSWLNR